MQLLLYYTTFLLILLPYGIMFLPLLGFTGPELFVLVAGFEAVTGVDGIAFRMISESLSITDFLRGSFGR